MTPAGPIVAGAEYVASVVVLYVELPHTPLRVSLQDHAMARRWYERGIPLRIVEMALLLGSLRRLIRPLGLPPLSPIRSLAYFQPVLDEILDQPAPPDSYLDYLRFKMRQFADQPTKVQK